MTPELLDRTPVPSCRLDTLSVTFRAPTLDRFDEICDLGYQLNSYVDESRPLQCKGRGRHFTHLFRGGGLVVLEGTPPLTADGAINEARNAGVLSLTLNGQFFAACDASERAELLLTIGSQPGFFHCTRLDAQVTLVDPEVSAERIVRLVEEGSLWAARFHSQRVYGDRNRDGAFTNGVTQYWGGKGSDITARSYDKAAEQGWDGSAVRHELQLRGDRANDRFIQLKGALVRQKANPPLLQTAEGEMVKVMLSQDLDYRDTSRWAGKAKPKNWAKSAPTPGWWRDAVGEARDSFEYSKRPKADLDQAYEAFLDQYGRKFALKVLKDAINQEELADESVMGAFLECLRRTKEGDAQVIAQELAGVDLGLIQEVLGHWQRFAASEAEETPAPWEGPAFQKGASEGVTAPHG